jgi:hypothetical protein
MPTTYLALDPAHWAVGSTPTEAKANLKRFGGKLTQHVVLAMPEGSTEHQVDGFGNVRWRWAEGADRTGQPTEVSRRGKRSY